MRIWVVIASVGRAELLCRALPRLGLQTRPPDGVLVVANDPADVAGLRDAAPDVLIALSDKGLCKQRNEALDRLGSTADAIVFFDDDFLPERHYIEQVQRSFMDDPQLVGLTGELIADGAHTRAIPFSDAARMIDALDRSQDRGPAETSTWLYGCNMAIRTAAAQGLRFDEALPLYGWQEDVDFSNRLARRGRMIRTPELTGIHLGTRGGRQSGLKLGYSQVSNIVYLLRKGTIGYWRGLSLMARNIAMNTSRSFWPEPEIDRRGRLAGNLLAIGDLLRGRVDPGRITSL